jgi:hypothetical protein
LVGKAALALIAGSLTQDRSVRYLILFRSVGS